MSTPDKRTKVFAIDTQPTDKGLFDPKIGGHSFGITYGSYLNLKAQNPNRYKLVEGQDEALNTPVETVTVTKTSAPAGLKAVGANVTADKEVPAAKALINEQTNVDELDKLIVGEIRKEVIDAYNKKRKALNGGK